MYELFFGSKSSRASGRRPKRAYKKRVPAPVIDIDTLPQPVNRASRPKRRNGRPRKSAVRESILESIRASTRPSTRPKGRVGRPRKSAVREAVRESIRESIRMATRPKGRAGRPRKSAVSEAIRESIQMASRRRGRGRPKKVVEDALIEAVRESIKKARRPRRQRSTAAERASINSAVASFRAKSKPKRSKKQGFGSWGQGRPSNLMGMMGPYPFGAAE